MASKLSQLSKKSIDTPGNELRSKFITWAGLLSFLISFGILVVYLISLDTRTALLNSGPSALVTGLLVLLNYFGWLRLSRFLILSALTALPFWLTLVTGKEFYYEIIYLLIMGTIPYLFSPLDRTVLNRWYLVLGGAYLMLVGLRFVPFAPLQEVGFDKGIILFLSTGIVVALFLFGVYLGNVMQSRRLRLSILQQLQYRIEDSKIVALGEASLGICNEINNPVQIISGLAEQAIGRLQNQALSKEDASLTLQKIIQQTDRTSLVIKSLRLYSRNRPDDPLTYIPFKTILQSVKNLTRERAQISGVALEFPSSSPMDLLCRPGDLLKALMAVLNNALDAVQEHTSPKISIYLRLEESEKAELVIEDNGAGISLANAKLIFEPFYSTKTDEVGRGLGLAVAQKLMREQNGDLHYEAMPQGARFVFTVSCRRQASFSQVVSEGSL